MSALINDFKINCCHRRNWKQTEKIPNQRIEKISNWILLHSLIVCRRFFLLLFIGSNILCFIVNVTFWQIIFNHKSLFIKRITSHRAKYFNGAESDYKKYKGNFDCLAPMKNSSQLISFNMRGTKWKEEEKVKKKKLVNSATFLLSSTINGKWRIIHTRSLN